MLALALLMGHTSCSGPAAPEAPVLPADDCTGRVILLASPSSPTNCNLTPPQVLASRLDDDPTAWAECDHAGGAIMHDPAIDRFYCIDMDY